MGSPYHDNVKMLTMTLDYGLLFLMEHKMNAMLSRTSKLDDVWFVDSGVSNYMTRHEEWFKNMREPNDPTMWRGEMTQHTESSTSKTCLLDIPVKKGYIKNIMYVSMKLWKIVSWINKLSNKELKFGSTKEVSSLGIRVDLSLMDVEKVDCSSST